MILTRQRLGLFRYVLYGHAVLVAAFLLLPVFFIGFLSFGSSRWLAFPPPAWTTRWYVELASDPRWVESLWLSLRLALTVAVLSVLLGGGAAFALWRTKFRGRAVIKAFFIAPMIVPVVILAIALYAFSLKLGLAGTFVGFVIGHLTIALPFSVICIGNALRGFDPTLEQASAICGASRLQTLLRVTLPGIALGILAAAVFSFLASWDEVVISIFMASPGLQTLPVKMWTSLRMDMTPVIAAASTLLVVASLGTMAVLGVAMLRRERKSGE
jgi:putative spermidine/putrescine transport system permease protein